MPKPTANSMRQAKRFRRNLTKPELMLWQELRQRPNALKFRRQHPIGPYVLDFYCPTAKLGIEVDGAAHDMGDRPARDERREAWLAEHGVGVLRLSASDVLRDVERAVEVICAVVADRRAG